MLTYTKKQLQKRFDISHNTLKDTIKVAGLNTAQRQYSEAEVYRLEQVRDLLTAGMTYEEVAAVMVQKSAEVPIEEGVAAPTPKGTPGPETAEVPAAAADVARAVEAGLTEQLQPVIDQATEKVLAQVPMMALHSLWTKVQQGRVQQAFQSSGSVWSALGGQAGEIKTIETTAQSALPTAASTTSVPPADAQAKPPAAPLSKPSRRIPRSPTRTSAPTPAPEITPPPVVVDDLDKQVLGELVEGKALEALTDTETA